MEVDTPAALLRAETAVEGATHARWNRSEALLELPSDSAWSAGFRVWVSVFGV